MKEICGDGCGWSGAEIAPTQKRIAGLADRVAAALVAGTLVPGADVIPSGVCPDCGGFSYPELPDRDTIGCVRARLFRISIAGTERKVDGTIRPGEKAPRSVRRHAEKALAALGHVLDELLHLESDWLDWKHPHGQRPDWNLKRGRKS